MNDTILIRNVRPMGGATADILIERSRIAAIGTGLAAPDGVAVEDGGGALALPGLIEGHAHIDKTLWGMGWVANDVGPTIQDKIDTEREWRARTVRRSSSASAPNIAIRTSSSSLAARPSARSRTSSAVGGSSTSAARGARSETTVKFS